MIWVICNIGLFFNIRYLASMPYLSLPIVTVLGVGPMLATSYEFCMSTDIAVPAFLVFGAVISQPILPAIAHKNDKITTRYGYILKIREVHWTNCAKIIMAFCFMVCLGNLMLLRNGKEMMPVAGYFSWSLSYTPNQNLNRTFAAHLNKNV